MYEEGMAKHGLDIMACQICFLAFVISLVMSVTFGINFVSEQNLEPEFLDYEQLEI